MSGAWPALVPAIGWALLHFVWQGLLIGWAASLGLYVLRGARPQARYALACGALLLCAALPLASIALRLADGALAAAYPAAVSVSSPSVSGAAGAASAGTAAAQDGGPAAALAGLALNRLLDADRRIALDYALRRQLPWVVLLWCCGAALMALRLAVGLQWVARRTAPGSYRTDPYWQRRLSGLARRFGIGALVRLGVATRLDSPVTAGCWRPVVLVPASLLTGMPPELLEALLAHELAHIKRHDYLVNLVQCGIEIILFYHPSVWALSRRIRVEREQVADDLACAVLGEPRRLAHALSELDRFQFFTPDLAHAAHGGDLMSRIKRLLRPDVEPVSWKMALPLVGLCAAGAVFYVHAAPPPPPPPEWRDSVPAVPAIDHVPPVAEVAPLPPAAAKAALAVAAASAAPAIPAAPAAPARPAKPARPARPAAGIADQAPPAPPAMPAAPMPAPPAAMAPMAPPAVSVAPAIPVAVGPVHVTSRGTLSIDQGRRDSYALVRAGSDLLTYSGNMADLRELDKVKGSVKGDFLLFRHDGKAYIVQDPAALAGVIQAWQPVEQMSETMKQHSARMEQLGKAMRELGGKAGVPEGAVSGQDELQRLAGQMALLARQQAGLRQRMAGDRASARNFDSATLREADGQAQKQAQAQIAAIGADMRQLGEQMRAQQDRIQASYAPLRQVEAQMKQAAAPMKELGRTMGELGRRQGQASVDAERATRALIDEALKKGQAQPAVW